MEKYYHSSLLLASSQIEPIPFSHLDPSSEMLEVGKYDLLAKQLDGHVGVQVV